MHYLFLAIAIVGELIGTIYLKYSDGFTKLVPSTISIVSYGLCFFFFSKSLLNINLGIAYATWSAVGLTVTTLISVLIFKESITQAGVIALFMIIIGIIILNMYGSPVK